MLLVKWVVSALGFLALPYIVNGISVASFWTALVLALLWGLVGMTIKPILLVLTLPINLLTFGIFTFILNGFLLWLLGGIVKGFVVDGFWVAVFGAFVLSVIHTVTYWALQRSAQ